MVVLGYSEKASRERGRDGMQLFVFVQLKKVKVKNANLILKSFQEGDVWIIVFPRCELEMYNIQADGQLNGNVKYVAPKRIKVI